MVHQVRLPVLTDRTNKRPEERNLQPADGWVVPNRTASSTDIALAHKVLETLREQGAAVRLAFLSGSLAAGLGHALSDVDLYVVGAEDIVLDHYVYRYGDSVVQVNPLTLELARRLVHLTQRFRATSTDRAQLDVDDLTLSGLVRLAISIPVYSDAEFDGFDRRSSVDTVRKIIMARSARACGALAEDAYGALRSKDWPTAVTAAQLAVSHGAECALAAAGDLYIGPKFLHRRLGRSPATRPIAATVWAAATSGVERGSSGDAVTAAVRHRLLLSNQLVGTSLLDGWNTTLECMTPPQVHSAGPSRSPFHALLRFADGIGLGGPDTAWHVSEGVARVWLALDGREPREAFRHLRRHWAQFRDQDDESLSAVVRDLVARGAACSD